MANEQNLVSLATRTTNEKREIGIKGGKASGEARRKKRTMLEVLEKTLNEIPKNNNEEKLSYQELATLGLIKGATSGNPKNYEIII